MPHCSRDMEAPGGRVDSTDGGNDTLGGNADAINEAGRPVVPVGTGGAPEEPGQGGSGLLSGKEKPASLAPLETGSATVVSTRAEEQNEPLAVAEVGAEVNPVGVVFPPLPRSAAAESKLSEAPRLAAAFEESAEEEDEEVEDALSPASVDSAALPIDAGSGGGGSVLLLLLPLPLPPPPAAASVSALLRATYALLAAAGDNNGRALSVLRAAMLDISVPSSAEVSAPRPALRVEARLVAADAVALLLLLELASPVETEAASNPAAAPALPSAA